MKDIHIQKLTLGFTYIIIPIAIILITWAFKRIFSPDEFFQGLGITLGATAMSQIFPFIILENLLIGKLLSIEILYKKSKNRKSPQINPQVIWEEEENRFKSIRIWVLIVFLSSLILFVMSLSYDITSESETSFMFGIINCIIVWIYLVFA